MKKPKKESAIAIVKADPLLDFAVELSTAWARYTDLFGQVPHGTEKQMAALLELTSFRRRFLKAKARKGSK